MFLDGISLESLKTIDMLFLRLKWAEEAIGAVAQYLRMKCTPENGNEYGFVWDLGENEKLHLTVKIENKDA